LKTKNHSEYSTITEDFDAIDAHALENEHGYLYSDDDFAHLSPLVHLKPHFYLYDQGQFGACVL